MINNLQYFITNRIKMLAQFNIMQTPEQYLFTHIDTKGDVNKPVHIDYLNNKMRSVENRHKLRHATLHKFSSKIEPENTKVYLILILENVSNRSIHF